MTQNDMKNKKDMKNKNNKIDYCYKFFNIKYV